MKRAVCFALLYVLVLSALPLYGQRTPIRAVPPSTDGPIQFGNTLALSDGTGVLVRWDTTVEAGNIGFYVYRLDGGSRELVNKDIVFGSAARVANGRALYGQQYEVFDPAGTPSSTYLVESIPANGRVVDSTTFKAQRSGRLSQFSMSGTDPGTAASLASPAVDKIVSPNAPSVTPTPDLTNQRFVASQPGIKIAVRREGMYRVTKAELAAAAPGGFDVNGSSTNWQLFGDGNEQAINIGASNAYIEFYGKPIDTVESETREYYLINGASAGKRMSPHFPKAIAGNVAAGNGRVVTELRRRSSYIDTIFNGDAENFWGDLIGSGGATIPVTVTGADTSVGTATITVKLQGFTKLLLDGFTPRSHNVTVFLNGTTIGSMSGSSDNPYQASFTVSTALFNDGNNFLKLQAATVTSPETQDFSLFDRVQVDFSRKFQPDSNRLIFANPQSRKISVGPFLSPTTSTVRIMDATQPTITETNPVAPSTTAGVLRLSSPIITAGEVTSGGAAANARITISRVFGNTGAVTVDLNLANGTATGGSSCGAGVDYVFPASPTVSLGSGVNSANVDVALCNDGITEAATGETFTATLSNPTGGATLATNNIKVFDTTYDNSVQQITSLPIVAQGGGLGFNFPAFRAGSMYAVDEAYELQSPEVITNTPSTLSSLSDSSNSANMVIITASIAGFKAAGETWADYRRGQGYTVKVVDVTDIMDEFGYGSLSSQAISSFLNFAQTNWTVKPQYVMLIGDGSYDPRNYLGQGYNDAIPMKFVTTTESETGSDEAVADFDGDGLSEMAVGRIPVRTVADITNVYNKTVRFETQNTFTRGAAFIYDQPKNPGDQFQQDSQTLRNELTTMSSAAFVDRGASNEGLADTLAVLSRGPTKAAGQPGPYIANYSGHGATGTWNNANYVTILNINQITNTNSESVYTMLTCLNGFFFLANGESFAETLLKSPNAGAVATWASTGLTTADKQIIMGTRFYNQLNAGTTVRIGDLIKDAKAHLNFGPDVRLSWALLGDPLLKMH